ncbi:MAG TPA: ABC transporter permease [Acidimicrobiia bacterium]|nr:ABC transporter permease [Acidimicrobiia bacterium]
MRALLPFIIVGITTGAVYALASMGLVLTYTTSGVFNFAHGAIGMFATFVFYQLRVEAHWPTWLAVAIAVLVVAPLMGIVVDRVLLTRLQGASPATYVVVSLGLLVALQSAAVAIFGGETRQVAAIFPTRGFELSGVRVGYDQTIVVVIAVVAGLGLAAFFRRTHLGLATRAVVGDRDLTELVGTDARAVTTFSWVLGSAFAALSGVLFAPVVGLDAVLLTLLVLQAFGAAVVGGLRSLPRTNLGAYGIAIAAAVSTKYVATTPALIGLPSAMPFIALFLVLVVSPKGSFAEVTGHSGGSGRAARGSGATARPGRVGARSTLPLRTLIPVVAAAAVLPVVLNGSQLLVASTAVAFVAIFASLSLLVGLSRQLSLCHAVFVVFGATTLSHLLSAGVPYVAALLLSALVLVPVGALVAIPTIRLSGLFLALGTFAFGALAQNLLYNNGFAFGRDAQVNLARPALFAGDTAFYYFILAVVTVTVVAVELVRITRLGRILAAIGDSPAAVQSIGVSPTASRVMVFCLAAFVAGIGGGLLGSLIGSVSTLSFDFFQSLVWLTVLVTAGAATLGGSVLAALLLIAVPSVFTSATVVEWQPVAFGVAAIVFAQSPNGIVGYLRRPDFVDLARRSAWRTDRRRATERRAAALAAGGRN